MRDGGKNVALRLLGRVKTNISLRDAVKLRSMQRPTPTMQAAGQWPWHVGNTPVEIHRVLCGNNTRQNERPVHRGVSPALFEEYTCSKASFKREAFTRQRILEIRAEWGQLFPTVALNQRATASEHKSVVIGEGTRG